MTHQSNKGECCGGAHLLTDSCRGVYVEWHGKRHCADIDCHQPQTSQAYVDSRTPEERERDAKIETTITYNEPPNKSEEKCGCPCHRERGTAPHHHLECPCQRKELKHEELFSHRNKKCECFAQRKETESWEAKAINEWKLHNGENEPPRWFLDLLSQTITKHTNEVLERERKGFEEILENNRKETLWGDADSNEVMEVSINSFIEAVKADLAIKSLHQHQVKEDNQSSL